MSAPVLSSYADFIASKRVVQTDVGIDATVPEVGLFPFQREIVGWALRCGRAAIFADTGLGKTAMQLAWAQSVAEHTGGDVLILAPLAVSAQTAREGAKFGIPVTVCREAADLRPGVNVTNYERLDRFDATRFAGIVLDESSILKSYSGTVRQAIQGFAEQIAFRLACTATPAPNDLLELTNHSEFIGAMRGKEMISLFFVADDASLSRSYRLKGHAQRAFYEWLASWSVALRRPSDLGFSDEGFVLPPLSVHSLTTKAANPDEGRLFAVEARTLRERQAVRRTTVAERVAKVAELVAREPDETWLLWCDLNAESAALTAAIPGAAEVRGSDSPEHKERVLLDFAEGRVRVLVTKPSIAGHGMNFQHCARLAFVGLSDSFEQQYQATRRCWRYGQKRPVHAYVVTDEAEGEVVRNIQRKERQAREMMDGIVEATGRIRFGRENVEAPVEHREAAGDDWRMLQGDSVEWLDAIEDESVGLSVFSPPFPGMYIYTNTPHDVGNSATIEELVSHLRFVVGREKLLRVVKPGRLACVHLMQLPAYETRDGYAGIRDYRGPVISMMQDEGWNYAGEVTIDKNPQVQATRHKEHGLLFKTLSTDASRLRMALADYLLYFRKPGDNPEPIQAGISPKYNAEGGWVTQEEWIEWAAPVWYRATKAYPAGIRETDVMNVRQAREERDERHLCPLQLGVIERAVKLWSNPGDLVLSPFAGIGSEGVEALRHGRRFLGIELKPSYFDVACRNLRWAAASQKAGTLFAEAEA